MSTTLQDIADQIEATFDLTTEAARQAAADWWVQIQEVDGHIAEGELTPSPGLDQEVSDDDAEFIIRSQARSPRIDRVTLMSVDQTLSDLADLRDRIEDARRHVADLEADRAALMITASEAGIPMAWITESAGVTRQRFYQLRDKARNHDPRT